MQKVTARPINAGTLICKRAKTAVVNTEANIKGYPARATANAVGFGGSDQEKPLIKLPHIWPQRNRIKFHGVKIIKKWNSGMLVSKGVLLFINF